jgi:hypothetical protein
VGKKLNLLFRCPQMLASLMPSIRFTLPSDQTTRLFSSIALSNVLISIISIHKLKV